MFRCSVHCQWDEINWVWSIQVKVPAMSYFNSDPAFEFSVFFSPSRVWDGSSSSRSHSNPCSCYRDSGSSCSVCFLFCPNWTRLTVCSWKDPDTTQPHLHTCILCSVYCWTNRNIHTSGVSLSLPFPDITRDPLVCSTQTVLFVVVHRSLYTFVCVCVCVCECVCVCPDLSIFLPSIYLFPPR